MGSLVLSAAGGFVGGLFGPIGATIGRAAGALAGALIDSALFGTDRSVGRLSDLAVQSAAEGAPMARVYGRVRLTGQIIWATHHEEEATSESAGGKGATTTTYAYYANVAVGLCEGPIARVGRIWANGTLLDRTGLTLRVYTGSEDQERDSLIEAKQGEGGTPAYRGTAYVVFERFPLDDYGSAVPQFAFEVIRPVGRLEERIRAVTLIPGATEFGYATTTVKRTVRTGVTVTENRHQGEAASDLEASLDQLTALCPNVGSVSLVVAWFGDDLRAGRCTVRPKVEGHGRTTSGLTWRVAGIGRADARVVSQVDDAPAFGGTPADAAVIEAIAALKARGLAVTLYPFLLMDVPEDNALANPATGVAPQPAYPWRGRITVDPGPDLAGTVDKTAAAATQVAAFLGTAKAADFTVADGAVAYGGPDEWRYRRMILHNAALAKAAGGVDGFLIGSEMPGLTTVRSAAGAGTRPFVEGLRALAADVKTILGTAAAVGYAADWSEWFGHHPDDGSGDRIFHLDPLWADAAIDFVGVDAYLPLTDWRDGTHADSDAADGPKDRDLLAAAVAGGEGYDWYYQSDAHRLTQQRTAVTDGGGKPWMFRFKDFAGWWGNLHHDRPGGVESAVSTAWRPGLKPFRFTEIGCPAVDFGANEPNVFPDALSSEGRAPRFSAGARDDGMQRRALEAMLTRFDPDADGFDAAANPLSPRDGRRMVDAGESAVWAWDARPHPAFPDDADTWSDAANWRTGHWITGRMGQAPLDDAVKTLLADCGIDDVETDGLTPVVDGLLMEGRSTPRALLETLAGLFRFRVTEDGPTVVVADRSRRPALALARADLVEPDGEEAVVETRRAQAEDAPHDLAVSFLDGETDGRRTAVTVSRTGGQGTSDLALPVTAAEAVVRAAAGAALRDLETGRDTVRFALPPTAVALEAGDVVRLAADTGAAGTWLVTRIEDGPTRAVEARRVSLAADPPLPDADATRRAAAASERQPPFALVLDLPLLSDDAVAHRPSVAATAVPWPGTLAIHRKVGDGYSLVETAGRPAVIGTLDAALAAGPVWRTDRGGTLDVTLVRGTLESRSEAAVLGGRNALAVGDPDGGWEILAFRTATLIGDRRYRLSTLLRGLKGTEAAAAAGAPAGSYAVLLDAALVALPIARSDLGSLVTLRIGRSGLDVADAGMTALSATPAGAGLTPRTPVRLAARRSTGGAVTISWIRRTRIGGDGWVGEVPLGETAELYRVTVHRDGTPVRVIEATTTAATYAAADQISDFGRLPATLDIGVRQGGDGDVWSSMTRRTIDV